MKRLPRAARVMAAVALASSGAMAVLPLAAAAAPTVAATNSTPASTTSTDTLGWG